MKFKAISQTSFKKFLFLIIIFALGTGFGYKYLGNTPTKQILNIERNTPRAFVSEIYDKLKENYWDNISDAQLLDLFKLSLERNGATLTVAKLDNKEKLLDNIDKTVNDLKEEQKEKFVVTIASQVLASLSPNGRSGLYTQKNEEQLKNTVSNINPEKDLYKDLGLPKGATESAVNQAYQQKAEELKKDKSPEAQEKLKQLTYAKGVLTNKDQKEKYDQNKIEPTIFTKVIEPGILYLQFKKFAPTSLEEFQKAFNAYQNNVQLNALILDLRGNIGGANFLNWRY
ncbi:MAG: DnaJ domain-containing protein, partial [Patescibacteria group bacterium]|nr:DnaJ domain-containing protein [Patescibacteria group bacterium]